MTTLTDLIARVEAAEGPDRELDAAIAKAIGSKRPLPRAYTDSLDAARTLVLENHQWAVGSCGENDGPWACVTFQDFDAGCPDFTSSAATEVLCLVAASLKAMEASHEG